MAKRNKNAKVGYGLDVNEPQDAIHMGEGKRIRLEDVPKADSDGDNQVGNRAYNDERYQFKGQATNNQQAAFLYGGYLIYRGTDLLFDTAPTAYILPGIDTPILVASVPIDLNDYPELNNGTDPQFVKPQWDVNGAVSVIFGPASVNPIEPTVDDPLTQIAGTSLLLNAGATSIDPGQVQTRVIYAEGAVGEASMTHEGSGSANFADSASPIAGTICANVSNVQNNSREVANLGEDINPTTFDVIAVRVQLKAVMASGYNLAIQFLDNANAPVSGLVNLPINKNELGIQLLSLSLDDFTFSAGLARKVTLHWRRGAGSVTFTGYRFDDWILQGGIAAPIVQGDVVLQGQVTGTGKTGTPINVVVTEKAISDQTLQTDALAGTEHILGRLSSGALVKIPASLLFGAGTPGADGADGREIELQNNGTHIQWRYVGDVSWINLVALSAITGPAGADGADGRDPEFQVASNILQWRLVGDTTWIDLIDLSTIGGSDPDYLASTGNILFDVKRKYGFTTAITGNLTCGITDAREDVVAKVQHNHTTEPTVSGPGGVTVVKDGGTYVPSANNTIYLVCHKNDAGTVFKITYMIAK